MTLEKEMIYRTRRKPGSMMGKQESEGGHSMINYVCSGPCSGLRNCQTRSVAEAGALGISGMPRVVSKADPLRPKEDPGSVATASSREKGIVRQAALQNRFVLGKALPCLRHSPPRPPSAASLFRPQPLLG